MKKMRRTTIILMGCVALLIGLFVAKYIHPISIQWYWTLAVLLPLLFTRKLRVAYVMIALLLIGLGRGGMYQESFQNIAQYYGQKVTINGYALEDGSYSYNGQLETVMSVETINDAPVTGKVTVRGYEPALYRNDTLEATGKIMPTKGGKQGTMSYADITVTARSNSTIEDIRHSFIAGMQNALPEPAASLGVGILVGQRSLLPDDVATALQVAGLTHIVAVSGYNLTIIINAVKRLTRRLSRFQTIAISAGLIYAFLLITGFSPSIVRASLVAAIGLAAWYYGRELRPIVLIMFVAAVTGFANPYYVWGDLGWYLSFLAFSGVLIVAPLIITLITKNKKELPLIPTIAIESFSAQLMTMPLIMYAFGRISTVGLLANSVIVPLVPLAMLTSFIAGVTGMVVPQIAGWIGLPARILLNSMINLSEWMASIPYATVALQLTTITMLVLYSIIGIVVIGLKKRSQSVIIAVK